MGKYSKIMKEFTIKNLPNLDVCVLGALELLNSSKIPKISFPKNRRLIVLGCGNALDTGMILFEEYDAIYASESIYKRRLKNIKAEYAIIISASGEKHSPKIAKYLKRKKIITYLLTNNENAKARNFVDKTYLFPKQREPYTYNTSTYLSMIFSKTKENPRQIISRLKKIDNKIPKNLNKYNAYNIIIPSKFDYVKYMLETKFDELFDPEINGRVFSDKEEKHAKTLVTSKKEMFVSIGNCNKIYGERKKRFNIPLSKSADYAEMISTGYYFIGKIQEQNKPFFKENILKYINKSSKIFGEKIKPIVE